MSPEHLSHRQLKVPEASPEPLAQLLARAQLGLESAAGLDTVRWLHDSLAFLAEFFAAFSVGALKTVGPYSSSLEQLLATAPSLERAERILAQAFIDWRAHPHHPAYESLRETFFLTSRLQSSRTAPRRHTRWLGIEGRAVEGLEQPARWSRRLDLLVSSGDDSAAQEQIRLYLPVLWIWTDALENFFLDWSLQLHSVVESGKLRIGGTANRDDIHLQLLSPHLLSTLKSNFVGDSAGGVQLDGFSGPSNGIVPATVESPSVEGLVVEPSETSESVTSATELLDVPGPDDLPDLPGPEDLPDFEPTESEPAVSSELEAPAEPEPVPVEPEPVSSIDAELFAPPLFTPDTTVEPVSTEVQPPLFAAEPDLVVPVEPEPVGVADPEPAPSVEPEPATAIEPEILAAPLFALDPEPVSFESELPLFATEPEPVVSSEPEPEPVGVADPEPAPSVEPEPVSAEMEPPLFATEPEPVVSSEPEPEPVVLSGPEPVGAADPEPAPSIEPEPVSAEIEPPLFATEPEPVASSEPEPVVLSEPEPVGAADPEPVISSEPAPVVATEPESPSPTPWADLIDSPTETAALESPDEADDELVDESAPVPDFIAAAPTQAEMPDFSADMPDFAADFGDFSNLPAFEVSGESSDFGLEFGAPVSEEPEAPVLDQESQQHDGEVQPSQEPEASEPSLPEPSNEQVPPFVEKELPAAVILEASSEGQSAESDPVAAPSQEVQEETASEGVELSIEPTSLPELPTSTGQATEMGAQAEEILDDNFNFSSEAGPAAPQWKGWGVSERETVQSVAERTVGAAVGRIPEAFAPALQALQSEVQKFQIILGPGCGKTHLGRDLCAFSLQASLSPTLFLDWPVSQGQESGAHELLLLYFRLRDEVKTRGGQALLPEPETVATLAASITNDGFATAFQRLLGQLAVLNKQGLTLVFDEPSEEVRNNIPATLPGKLRIISLVSASHSGPELGEQVDLQSAWPQAAVELFGPMAAEVASAPAANLLRVALHVQIRQAGGEAPVSLADIGKACLTAPGVDPELLACLALEEKPISFDDLDQWFLDSGKVAVCLEKYPSLFCLHSTRLSPQLGLSHRSIAIAVKDGIPDVYQGSASRLLGWVVSQLERTNSDKYGGLQVRDIVFRNFCRLYHFAALSGSAEILEWVARNKDLQRNRVALTAHLEKPAYRWDLQRLLTLLSQVLSTLLATERCRDLRDELAWALSNTGLNLFHLGLYHQGRERTLEALEIFTVLVDKEKQHEFRSALATTLYRAAKIAESLKLGQEAHNEADRAVSELVELVEDRGRTDLQSRLGIAMVLRGTLKNESGDTAGALKDLQRASSLIASAPEDKQQENKSSQIELHLVLASIYLKTRDFEQAVKESGKAVQLATQAVEELQMEDLQPLLATCHTSRARCFLEIHEVDRAQRDVSKSIALRNLAVDEGRLEQRFELSREYLLRAQIDRGRGMSDDAGRDLNRAIETLDLLDQEGRKDAKHHLLIGLVERSQWSLAQGDSARSIEDLRRAFQVSQEDTSGSSEAASARVSVLDGLLRAYLRAGDSEQALHVSTELLSLYQEKQDWENYARVQVVRGDALERQSNLAGAGESYNQAVGLLSKLLEQGQTETRLEMVAEAYLGSGSVELKLGNFEHASEQMKRSLEVFSHLFSQRGMRAVLPKMLKAYSQFASANLNAGRVQDALVSLKSGFDILAYLEKEGGSAHIENGELRRAELFRTRAQALLQQGEFGAALQDSDEAQRNFLLDRQINQAGPWKDELARTSILRSLIFFALKDFTQAESAVQDAITHFEEHVRAGRVQYLEDLMKALSTRAENAGKAGKIDRVLEEYNRMLGLVGVAGQAGAAVDVDLESARILEKRARVYRDQSLFNEAYGDYERVITLYRKILSERPRSELAVDLVRVHLERGEMIAGAGHPEHATGDFTQAIDLAKALVAQGQLEAASMLARALQRRADCFRASGKAREALQDLEGAVGFQMQMAQQRQEPELMGNLAKSLLSQGILLAGFQQLPQAAASLDKAIGIFTSLVEQQNQRQHSSDMAQALIQRVSLTGDKTDPALRQVLIRAVDLVTVQAREGKPVARDFPIDCLRAVVDLLTREDFDTVGDLIDAVLRLVELVVTDGKSNQDFVKLTDLLLAASAGLIDDRRTARRPHFLALACVSCNREIQMFGKASLPRLVYCLYELGQALERSKPPTVLNYIGGSFTLLGELASQQQNNEDFLRELKMMVTTWRSLPPQVPALANVSRHLLSQLLRLT